MNLNEYSRDPRYWAVWQKMQLLDIRDVSTDRQDNNGTIVWQLPIKNNNSGKTNIEVASFSTGYVRNQNSGYSNYQLNKRCEGEPEFFDSGRKDSMGRTLYTQFTTRSCVLIPIEIDRLEYLISYCLKNYYIKRANEVVDGKFVPEWYHNDKLDQANETYSENTGAMARIHDLEGEVRGLETKYQASQGDVDTHVDYQIKLEEKLVDITEARDYYLNKAHSLENKLSNAISPTKYECAKQKLHDLENKLATINRISE